MHFILVVLGNCDTNDAVHVHLGCETNDLRFFYQSPGVFRSVMRHFYGSLGICPLDGQIPRLP